jgi:hypothetical protein
MHTKPFLSIKRNLSFYRRKAPKDGIVLSLWTYVIETLPSACFLQECEEFVRLHFLLLLIWVSAVPSMRNVLLCSGSERGQPETQGSSVLRTSRQL